MKLFVLIDTHRELGQDVVGIYDSMDKVNGAIEQLGGDEADFDGNSRFWIHRYELNNTFVSEDDWDADDFEAEPLVEPEEVPSDMEEY